MSSSSYVWEYFDKEKASSGFATCLQCRRKYKTSGNTSNLIDHLKRAHNVDNPKPAKTKKRSLDDDQDQSVLAVRKNPRRSQTLMECLSYKNVYDRNDPKKLDLNKSLIDMISIDLQPFNIVSDEGFKMFVNKLDKRYKLPSRNVVQSILLPKRYNEVKALLQKIIQEVKYISLTTDSWTSSFSSESYITVTCHFIRNYNLHSFVLETEKFGQSHTAANIAQYLKGVINNWGLTDKVSCIVTDNAAYIKAAITLLGVPHLPCAAHTLNLVVEDTFKEVSSITELLTKCRKIVTQFKKSSSAMEILNQEQQNRKDPELKLLQDVRNRWNSVFFMIKRILEVNDSLLVALSKIDDAPPPINYDDHKILNDLCEVLRPFNDATEQLSGATYVTSSLIITISTGIQVQMKSLKPVTAEGEEFRVCIFKNLVVRFNQFESKNIVSRSATILDPRFKKLVFTNNDNALTAVASVQNEITKLNKESTRTDVSASTLNLDRPSTSTSSAEERPVTSVTTKNTIFDYLKEKTQCFKKTTLPASGIIMLRQYLEKPNIELEENPLLYWAKENNPHFNILVEKYLCVPATSVPSERVFSKSGQVLSERRSKLKPKNVNMILFLNQNTLVMQNFLK